MLPLIPIFSCRKPGDVEVGVRHFGEVRQAIAAAANAQEIPALQVVSQKRAGKSGLLRLVCGEVTRLGFCHLIEFWEI